MTDALLTADEIARADGRGIRIAVVDSGVERSHPVFSGADIPAWTIGLAPGQRVVVSPDGAGDVSGHGTAVVSIIREFAPGASVESIRVLGGDLRGSSERVLAALHWAIDQRFDVVNCSFGTSDAAYLDGYKRVVDRAFCENVLLVSACNNVDARRLELPGWFPTVITANHGALAGLAFERRAGEMVEFVARGRELRLPWRRGAYQVVTGSSFAAPHLAALAARIRQLRPAWNACEMKAALYRLATTPGAALPRAGAA